MRRHAEILLLGALVATASCRSDSGRRDEPAAPCLRAPQAADAVGASYASLHLDGATESSRSWQYWRAPGEVAFELPQDGVVEVWKQYGAELGFERWFPEHGRSVTYTSGDLRALGKLAPWAEVTAVVPPLVREKLEPAGTAQYRCLAAERLRGQVDGRTYELLWLPEHELVAALEVQEKGAPVLRLRLEALHDAAQTRAALARGKTLAPMDYADIGDNEADPFVAQMIELGFVEHPVEHDRH